MNQLEDISFWRQLNRAMEIESQKAYSEPIEFSDERLSEISDSFWREGYLHLPPVFETGELGDLKQAIETLGQHNLPPVFIYVYDAPWVVFHRLKQLIEQFLGEAPALLPHLWAWHIPMDQDSAGWPPHVDCVGETRFDDLLMSLSLWVPLTDVTPENGCMHVLPRTFEKQYEPPLTKAEQIKLQDVRALPAKTGSVLGWPQDLWHWSGRSSALAAQPRISLSLEFQSRAFEPMAEPWLDTSHPPRFEDRLTLIARQFGKYTHMAETPDHLKDFIEERASRSLP